LINGGGCRSSEVDLDVEAALGRRWRHCHGGGGDGGRNLDGGGDVEAAFDYYILSKM